MCNLHLISPVCPCSCTVHIRRGDYFSGKDMGGKYKKWKGMEIRELGERGRREEAVQSNTRVNQMMMEREVTTARDMKLMRWWEPRNGCVEVEMMKMLLLLLLQATGSQKPKVSRSRWRGEAEDEALLLLLLQVHKKRRRRREKVQSSFRANR